MMAAIDELAEQRNEKDVRCKTMFRGKWSTLDCHRIGLAAEFSVAHLLCGTVDTRIYDNHGDNGSDMWLPDFGITEIKAVTHHNPDLKVPVKGKHGNVESYILVSIDPDDFANFCIEGWLSRKEVIGLPQKQYLENGPLNYFCNWRKLHSCRSRLKICGSPRPN